MIDTSPLTPELEADVLAALSRIEWTQDIDSPPAGAKAAFMGSSADGWTACIVGFKAGWHDVKECYDGAVANMKEGLVIHLAPSWAKTAYDIAEKRLRGRSEANQAL